MIKLMVFDYDGVIFDTLDIAYNLVMGECKKYCKVPLKSKKEFLECYKSNFYEEMKRRGVSRKDMEKLKKESIDILARKKLKLHPGMKQAVKKLSRTHTLAVISSNYDKVMKKNLEKHGILGNFNFILGTEEGESKKEKIRKLLKETKTKGPEAVFITDTVGDIKEARKAGIRTMAVTWGFHSKETLKKAKPDFVVDKPKQMTEVML